MEITFTKTDQRNYETFVRRDDDVVLSVKSPDRPSSLPHDMAHYLVERELRFERGFWGSVAVCARLDEAWRPFKGPRRAVSAEEGLRVCQALREAETQWQALPVGQSITVSWPAQTNKSAQRSRLAFHP